jgi:murein DD-endopeptidase
VTDAMGFLLQCSTAEGKPYVWGAKGPDAFDCSGLVTWALHECGGPDWRNSHNSARLFAELAPVEKPQEGDLAFYGQPGRVTHVMVCWGDGRVYGACGGDSTTTSVEMAKLRKAKVQYRAKADYRPGFLGFRRLP